MTTCTGNVYISNSTGEVSGQLTPTSNIELNLTPVGEVSADELG